MTAALDMRSFAHQIRASMMRSALEGFAESLMTELLPSDRQVATGSDREVHTLDHWRRLLARSPSTIECSSMRLFGHDDEGAIFSGPGRIEIRGDTDIRFYLYGTTEDGSAAFRKLKAARDNPYDVLQQFRLFATDYTGTEWTGGWTDVDFFTDHTSGWPLAGELRGLSTRASGVWVSKTSSVELLLIPPVSLPMSEVMTSTSRFGSETIQTSYSGGRHSIEVLGTKVVFANEPSDEALWITAETSDQLKHPFAERWLCEPLRILFGAPIYPRLTARNFGDGTAFVTLLPAPSSRRPSAFGLMHPHGVTPGHGAAFWKLYADILTMIARARTPEGHEIMDGHEITRFYEEFSEAERGSRWVMLLTLASTTEALSKSLMDESDRRSEFSDEVLASMKRHIKGWAEDTALRGRMLNGLAQARERSVLAFLRDLAAKGIIPDYCETWRRIRNSVMHGELVEPWSTQESDGHLREMIALVHALTRARIAKG